MRMSFICVLPSLRAARRDAASPPRPFGVDRARSTARGSHRAPPPRPCQGPSWSLASPRRAWRGSRSQYSPPPMSGNSPSLIRMTCAGNRCRKAAWISPLERFSWHAARGQLWRCGFETISFRAVAQTLGGISPAGSRRPPPVRQFRK
jgi:hypothetical protein